MNADLYLAREERKRWANVSATNFTMPDSDELARLMEIVREAEPDLRFDDDDFRRAFWAVGQMWRAAEIDKSRYFVSYVDDASDLLRMRRQSDVSGSALLAAVIAHGDIRWRRGDAALGVTLEVALDKKTTAVRVRTAGAISSRATRACLNRFLLRASELLLQHTPIAASRFTGRVRTAL